MPWVHRGILALIFQRTEFLMDFGREKWKDDPNAEWTPADLEKILTNFIEEGTGRPLFSVKECPGPTYAGPGFFKVVIEAKLNIGVIMPRGFSKTTLMNAANLISILYKDEDFFLYISEAAGHAERQLGSVKQQLEDEDGVPTNELIYAIFGAQQPSRQSSKKWTEKFIETLKDVTVGATGTGGQVRGFGKNGKRPGRIIFDDLEDEDSVKNDELRKSYRRWFFGTAMPALRRIPTPGRAFIIGTMLHTDAILNKVIVSDRFTAVRFGAIDRQGAPLWAHMMDLDEIAALQASMAAEGEAGAFSLEYMSEYKDDKTRVFPESKLIYISKAVSWAGIALAQDPAISEKKGSDYCTFGVVGQEHTGHKHVLDYYGQVGMDPSEQVDKFFELWFRNCLTVAPEFRKAGIEAVAFQQALISLVRAKQYYYAAQGAGMEAYFEIEPITHGKTAKDERIKGVLKPLVSAGWLTFDPAIKVAHPELHGMLIDYPNGKKDGPDVIAMAVRLLDPFAALFGETANENGMSDMTRDRAPPLRQVIGGNWRVAP